MNWLYPKVRNLRRVLPFVLVGSLIAGLYGSLHDQVSFSISKEYFSHFKFHQFRYVDFGLPDRAFVAIVGFLATWWVGMIGAWILARIRFDSGALSQARRQLFKSFGIVFLWAVAAGAAGLSVGYVRAYHCPLPEFFGWEKELNPEQLRRFVVVGYLHNSGYLGGLIGLLNGVSYIRRCKKDGAGEDAGGPLAR